MTLEKIDFKYAPYSYSRLSTYETCPRRFKYQYIEKVKQGDIDRSALIRGSAIHKLFEEYPKAPKEGKFVKDFSKALESDSVKVFKEHISESGKSFREFAFGLTPDFEPCTYSSKQALFRGKVDLGYVDNNILHLVDFKTGKAKDLKYQDFDQLLLYSIYFFQKYSNVQEINVSYVYVDHDVTNSLTFNRENLEVFKAHFKSIVYLIEGDKEYNPKKSRLCDYCPFKEYCL